MNKLLITFIIFINFSAYAKWMDLKDAPYETIFYNSNITVKEDGTSEEIVESEVHILNEGGRQEAASFIKTYNQNDSKLTILDAYTINNNVKYPLDLKLVEDKPLASSPHGFDQTRQIMLSLPNVEIGSKTYVKYSRKVTETELPNFYNNRLYFALNKCCQSSHRKIISKIPLYIEVNDPDNVLQIKQEQKDGQYILDVTLKQPICRAAAATSETGIIRDNKFTWISISSFKTWEEYAIESSKKYQEVINQELPSQFIPIVKEALLEKDEITQLNLITSLVNQKIRYMGYWTSIKGQFVPRDLRLIAESQEGDCKDFTAITAAILKAIGGYKVQPALISRGEGYLSLPQTSPNSDLFNHVLLKLTNKNGKVYWIDPTNIVSMAQGMFPDIADKITLVLDPKNPLYQITDSIKAENCQLIESQKLEIKGNNLITSGEFTTKGENSLWFAGTGLSNSDEVIKDKLFYILSNSHLSNEEKKELILPNLNSRVVEDLNFKFKYQQSDQFIKSNLGNALQLNFSRKADLIIDIVPGQLSDIYIGPITTIKNVKTLENKKIKHIKSLNYEKDSPWIYIKRSCEVKGNNSIISDIIIVKKSFITSEELQSEEYKSLKRSLEKNANNIIIISD